MKLLQISILFILFACGNNQSNYKKTETEQTPNKFEGIYEYSYSGNTTDLNENQFIVLKKNNEKLAGRYYGTSDEFEDAREGYLPGFFVSTMENLQIDDDSISFQLNTKNTDFLTKSVDLKYYSTKDALFSGYKNWPFQIETKPKIYNGVINDTFIFFRGEKEYLDKKFLKKK